MPKKALILANNSAGLYKFRKELLLELIKQKYEVFISVPYGDLIEQLKLLGCKFIETPIDRRGTNPISDFKLLLSYKKLIKRIKPDIVLTYTVKPNIYGGMVCSLTKTPYLSNVTGLGTSIENGGLLSKIVLFLYKTVLKNATKIFFQNEKNQKSFEKMDIATKNTLLIPGSGVNLIKNCFEQYPQDNGKISFLFMGRLMKDKGVVELVHAAKKIKEKYEYVEFDLLGSAEKEFEAEFAQLNKEKIVCHLGKTSDVRPYIKSHHAVILPSYHEGMSNALLEAAAIGRPILASDVPGCQETFDEDVSGFGFEAKNADSLYTAIERFLWLSYEEKIKMGLAGRKKMECEFDRNVVVNAYMTEINKICRIEIEGKEYEPI